MFLINVSNIISDTAIADADVNGTIGATGIIDFVVLPYFHTLFICFSSSGVISSALA